MAQRGRCIAGAQGVLPYQERLRTLAPGESHAYGSRPHTRTGSLQSALAVLRLAASHVRPPALNIQPSAVHLPSQRTASGITARCIARCSAQPFMPVASAVPDALPSTGQFALPVHSRERAAGRLARGWSRMDICLGRVLCCGAAGSASAWTFPGQMLVSPGRLSASACHSASCFPPGRL